jgi:hypothetical protein
MKTSELTGAALDWAVAKAIGDYKPVAVPSYSTNWSQGGPIIEREAITVSEGSPVLGLEWMACDRGSTHIQHGPTYLIAAMRCYVASKLGDEVEIPEELTC